MGDYIDYICKKIPFRQRAMSGLALKVVSQRMNNEDISETQKEFHRLSEITDEKYELEVSAK